MAWRAKWLKSADGTVVQQFKSELTEPALRAAIAAATN
jgi:hypothetical protein